MDESIVFTFPYQANRNHATEPSTVGQVISKWDWKSTFDFTKIVNNCGLEQGTVYQIVRFISQFSLKLYIQFWKYFHSVVLGSVGRGSCGKNRVLEFLAKNIWLGCLSVFKFWLLMIFISTNFVLVILYVVGGGSWTCFNLTLWRKKLLCKPLFYILLISCLGKQSYYVHLFFINWHVYKISLVIKISF